MNRHAHLLVGSGWGLALLSLALPAMGQDVYGFQALWLSFVQWTEIPGHVNQLGDWYGLPAAVANLLIYPLPFWLYRSSPVRRAGTWATVYALTSAYIGGLLAVLGASALSIGYYVWLAGCSLMAAGLVVQSRHPADSNP